MLHSPLGRWHVRVCEFVYSKMLPAFVWRSVVLGWVFDRLTFFFLLEFLVTWRDNRKGGARPSL